MASQRIGGPLGFELDFWESTTGFEPTIAGLQAISPPPARFARPVSDDFENEIRTHFYRRAGDTCAATRAGRQQEERAHITSSSSEVIIRTARDPLTHLLPRSRKAFSNYRVNTEQI